MKYKTMKKSLYGISMATLLVAGFVMIACDNKENQAEIEESAELSTPQTGLRTYTLTIKATKGAGQTTRALTEDDVDDDGYNDIISTWNGDEKVSVHVANYNESYGEYIKSFSLGELTPTPDPEDPTRATLTGTLDFTEAGDIDPGQKLYLKVSINPENPESEIEKQDGTLAYISENLEEYEAYVDVVTFDDETSAITTTDAVFSYQQSIVKFTLSDKDGNAIQAKTLNIDFYVDIERIEELFGGGGEMFGGGGEYFKILSIDVSPDPATDILYVAIPDMLLYIGLTNITLITLSAETKDASYYFKTNEVEGLEGGIEFVPGQFYDISVKMKTEI